MGNKCSTKTPNPLLDNDLNDYDREVFNIKREKVFYGTIAICILYGSFALILFVLSFFSDKIKYLLLNSFLPFTIIYVIGTILIIFYLIHQVLNFKPYKLNKDGNYDNLSCPDYWILEQVYNDNDINSDSNLKNTFNLSFESNAITNNLFSYRCVLNSNIFNSYDIFKASSNVNSDGTSTSYTGNYHFFNSTSNSVSSLFDSNNDLISDPSFINNRINPPNNGLTPPVLYANIYNNSTSNIIDVNIFKKDKKLKLNYEIAKAALLMNNYKILNYNTTEIGDGGTYTDFYREYDNINDANIYSVKDFLKKLNIQLLNFDYKTGDTDTDYNGVNNKIIRLYKSDGTARICNKPASISNGEGNVTNCLVTNAADSSTSDTGFYADRLPLNCEKLYPMYMASVDQSINKQNRNMDTNTMRCAYSKICGIPWSDMNCDKYFENN